MPLCVVGFIDNPETRRPVMEAARGIADSQVVSIPNELPKDWLLPNGTDVLLVLHLSQSSIAGLVQGACFQACANTLAGVQSNQSGPGCDVNSNSDFADYQEWVHRHREAIKAIVVTTGGGINDADIAAGRNVFASKDIPIPVYGMDKYVLSERLRRMEGVKSTCDALALLVDPLESVLEILTFLFQIGLIMEVDNLNVLDACWRLRCHTNCNFSRENCIYAAEGVNCEMQVLREDDLAVIHRMLGHLKKVDAEDTWPGVVGGNLVMLDRLLHGNKKTGKGLDEYLKELTESPNHLKWYERMIPLRDELLEACSIQG